MERPKRDPKGVKNEPQEEMRKIQHLIPAEQFEDLRLLEQCAIDLRVVRRLPSTSYINFTALTRAIDDHNAAVLQHMTPNPEHTLNTTIEVLQQVIKLFI